MHCQLTSNIQMRSEYDTICTIKLDTEGLVIMAFNSEYALEHAAGTWWIIKCAQTSDRYTPPVPVNDSGAEIFRGFIGNKTAEEIAMQLASEYGISVEEALADVNAFVRQLAAQPGFLPRNNEYNSTFNRVE